MGSSPGALAAQQTSGKHLGQILIDRGHVSGPALTDTLAEQDRIELTTEEGFGAGLRAEIERRDATRRPDGGLNCRARLTAVPTRDEVIEALRQVEDPELGMDIVDLGLLYDVEVEGPRVKVTHSLTSMGCPVGPLIQEDINRVARELPGVEDVDVELTWDPPWTPDKMSDDAKFILGFG